MNHNWMQMAMATAPGGSSGAPGSASDPMAGLISLLPLLLIFVLFYVLFIIPQRRQQKEHQTVLKALKKGDEVLTTGGIFGRIVDFNEREDTVFLKLSENVKVEIQRASIAGLRKPAASTKIEKSQ